MVGLSQTCTINRNVAVGTNGRSQKQALYTNVPCLALPMSSHTAIENKFDLGRAFDINFAEGQDVKIGDQVVIGSSTYDVKYIRSYTTPTIGYVLTMCEEEV